MRVDLPFEYTINAVPYRHKNVTNISCVEYESVDIDEVAAEDMVAALTIRDLYGYVVEEFFGHDGRLWIKNDRGIHDSPFRAQHLKYSKSMPHLAGNNTPYGHRGSSDDEIVAKSAEFLASVGLFQVKATGADVRNSEYGAQTAVREHGRIFLVKTAESQQAKKEESSTREERRAAMVTAAEHDLILVDGDLWVAVPEPVGYGRRYTAEVLWEFSGRALFTEESLRDGYTVSMLDVDKVADWFEDGRGNPAVAAFEAVVDDPSFLRAKTRETALVRDALIAVNSLDKSMSTDRIHAWTALRDHIAPAVDRYRSQPEAFYDKLAALLDTFGQLAEQPSRWIGLEMFDARKVSIDMSLPTPSVR